MKVFVILLLGLQIFWAAAAAKTTVAPPNLDQQCGSYCYTVLRTSMQTGDQAKKDLEASKITIQNKDEEIKQLQSKINNLQAKQSVFSENEAEHEDTIQSTDDLVSSISQKIDAIRNKVRDITQINSGAKEPQK
ncbi:uncharacterized protein LOC117787563 isoform X2 [Drosophila innubila]|uniref:uncharacterized protein LOC117787563 isoform X2 n=1 Tax=Drosophila innubila TaxID=198719 RepID=UPI00148DEC0C|nr:uncharacterized protein LOC117787563 isoform X2 [Drosophila innubila]